MRARAIKWRMGLGENHVPTCAGSIFEVKEKPGDLSRIFPGEWQGGDLDPNQNAVYPDYISKLPKASATRWSWKL